MLAVAAHELGYSPAARPLFRRQRPRAGCPHGGLRQDPGDIAQRERADAGAQICVATITGVHQHHAARKAGLAGRSDLLKRDLPPSARRSCARKASSSPCNSPAAVSPVGVANHARQPLDINRKSRFNRVRSPKTHLRSHRLNSESCQITDTLDNRLRLSDSVVLAPFCSSLSRPRRWNVFVACELYGS
jgi:hypothetical protein